MRPFPTAFHALLTSTAAVSLLAACGSSSSGNGGPTDAATDVANDVIHYPPTDSGEGGMVVAPSGTQLVASTDPLLLYAVTSDGYAIYANTMTTNLYAASVTGGANQMPTAIVQSVGANAGIIADGPVALIWSNLTPAGIGTLSVWTAANGAKMLSNASSAFLARVSKDQTHVVFLDATTATSTAIAVAGVDGTGKATLVPMATISATCAPNVGFAGNDAIAAYCQMGGTTPMDAGAEGGASDAGTGGAGPQITRYTGASWMPMPISTAAGATAFDANSTGDHVLWFDNGGLEAYSLASGMSTPIDPNGDSFVITPDGTKVVYGTVIPPDAGSDAGGSLGPFKVSPIASPSPTTLGSGIFAFNSISPDGNWVQGFSQQNAMTMYTNVILASTMTPGTPQMLVTTAGSQALGDSWTTDSKFAIYTDTILMTTTAAGMVTSGNVSVVGLTAGAMPMPLGMSVWQVETGPASKILFNPNWTAPTNTGFGTADLMEIDMSQASPTATTLVTAADANFFPTSDKKTIVYSYSNGGSGRPTSQSGLWAMPTP
jgi:hypothetical protein